MKTKAGRTSAVSRGRGSKPVWSGMIGFGLVNIPIRLLSAVKEHRFKVHFLHGSVVFTYKELEKLDPESARRIAIMEFVDEKEIDPMFLDAPYFVAPENTSSLSSRAQDTLVLELMRFADEIVKPKEI